MTFSLLQITMTTFETDNIREMVIMSENAHLPIHALKKNNTIWFGIIKMCNCNIQINGTGAGIKSIISNWKKKNNNSSDKQLQLLCETTARSSSQGRSEHWAGQRQVHFHQKCSYREREWGASEWNLDKNDKWWKLDNYSHRCGPK